MAKKTNKFRQFTSMMTDAGARMQENMTNYDRTFDRKSLARITRMLAIGVAVVALIHIIHLFTLLTR